MTSLDTSGVARSPRRPEAASPRPDPKSAPRDQEGGLDKVARRASPDPSWATDRYRLTMPYRERI